MKQFWRSLKKWGLAHQSWLNFLIIGVTLFFLALTFYKNWQAVREIQITGRGWALIAIATGLIQVAYLVTSWVWAKLLQDLGQSVSRAWAIQIYLTTNIAKYLPSNLLHLYGRTLAATDIGIPVGVASLSVLLDSLLMVASGLLVGLFSLPNSQVLAAGLCLIAILSLIHPWSLKTVMRQLLHRMGRSPEMIHRSVGKIQAYPIIPLLGELLYVVLRGSGFVVTLAAVTAVPLTLIPSLVSAASVAWLLGFITPGLPAGIGVFELTLITLLNVSPAVQAQPALSIGAVLSSVAIYRLVITLAEGLNAALAWLDQRRSAQPSRAASAVRQCAQYTAPLSRRDE